VGKHQADRQSPAQLLAIGRSDCDISLAMLIHHVRRALPIPLTLALLSLVITATTARAQSGAELLFKPWATGQRLEGQAEATFLNDGHTKNANDFQLSYYNTSGRLRLWPEQKADPRFGYNITYLNTDTNDPALPSHMIDTSVAVGTGIADVSGWRAGDHAGPGLRGGRRVRRRQRLVRQGGPAGRARHRRDQLDRHRARLRRQSHVRAGHPAAGFPVHETAGHHAAAGAGIPVQLGRVEADTGAQPDDHRQVGHPRRRRRADRLHGVQELWRVRQLCLASRGIPLGPDRQLAGPAVVPAAPAPSWACAGPRRNGRA